MCPTPRSTRSMGPAESHFALHLHSLHPPRPPIITVQITLWSALGNRFQHARPTFNLDVDGTAFIDISLLVLLPSSHSVGRILIIEHAWNYPTSAHRHTLTPPSLFGNPPSPSFSVKRHAWNIIGRESHRRAHTRPRRIINILSFSETFLGTPPTRIPSTSDPTFILKHGASCTKIPDRLFDDLAMEYAVSSPPPLVKESSLER